MGLLYPGVDDEDVMQWYLNTHYLDGLLGYQPPPSDNYQPPSDNYQPPSDNYQPPLLDDMYDELLEIVGGGIIDPGPVYSEEEYAAYLDSLPPTTESAPLSIAYDSYSGSPYTY